MTEIWAQAALVFALALIASLLAHRYRLSVALVEIMVGVASGLTFGTISALFGLSSGIISESQYSTLVAAIIGTAAIPTLVANRSYLPQHLPPEDETALATSARNAEVEESPDDSEVRS